jgi:hypothetical protein
MRQGCDSKVPSLLPFAMGALQLVPALGAQAPIRQPIREHVCPMDSSWALNEQILVTGRQKCRLTGLAAA